MSTLERGGERMLGGDDVGEGEDAGSLVGTSAVAVWLS